MSFTLRLPLKLVSVANLREHWAVKARRTKAHRQAAAQVFRAWWHGRHSVNAQKDLLADGLAITLTRFAPRELDSHDNLRTACKPLADGITDALGLKSDRDNRVTWLYAQRRGAPREYAVEVRLEQRTDGNEAQL